MRIAGRTTVGAAALAACIALIGAVGVDAAPVGAAACAAATLTAPVVADTWLDEDSPLTPKGSDPILSVDAGSTDIDTGAPNGRARALLQFALPEAVPAGCVVASARLSVFSTGEQVGARVEAVRLASAWTESGTAWSNQPATLGEPARAWSREGSMRWNVTAQVQAMLDGGDHGFLIRDAAEGGEAGGDHGFHSRENGDAGTAATLRISFAAPGSGELPGPPLPPTPASVSCGDVLTQSTLVTNDLSGCPGDGLVVGAPRIIVDLGGHTIDGTGLGGGIRNDGHSEVTVRNGTVQEFDYGVQLLPDTTANLVERLSLRLNQVAAVELFDVSASEIRGNSLEGNGGGIELVSGTRDSVVAGNTITATGGAGLLVRDARTNLLEGNSVAGGGDLGIGLERAVGNVLLGNTSVGNSDGGIELRFGSHGNRLEGNTITESGDTGIIVSESDRNELIGNVAHFMSDSGITLDAANDGVVRGNDVRFNTGGLQLDGSSRNLLEENDAGETTGIGIELGGGSLENVLDRNTASDNGALGIYVADDANDAAGNPLPGVGNLVRANTANGNGSDGIVLAKGGHTVTANVTRDNHGWGINAALVGTIDGGGNVASGNGKPEQCVGVVCTSEGLLPETFITDAPADPTNRTVATFGFAATGAAGFECSFDDDAFSVCVSPLTYTDLAPGRHEFQVRARDAAGSVDPTPAAHGWTVDTSAPETTITSAPPASTTSTSASFSFTAGELGSSFECALDAAAFAACTSPRTHSGLAPGGHQFRVRAIDAAGNVDPTPATALWTIASPPPPGDGGGGGGGGGADADLVTSLATSASAVAAGDSVAVTVSVVNKGGLAEGVTITLTLSTNVSLAGSSADRGPGCGPGTPVVCDLDFLGPPGTIRLALAVIGGGPVVVGAFARALQRDANPADNDATLTIPAVAAAPAPLPPSGRRTAARPTIRTGTARADTLRGTAGRDVLRGLGGRDVLYGLGGDDTLVGGTGVDRLIAGAGNDTILARDGARDTVTCGSGRDVVQADRSDRIARDCERVTRKRARRS